MATVTATHAAPVRAGATASSGGSTATGTGFGELLAALVPGATGTPVLAPTTSTPPGVCGAGPEASVSPEDVAVGATDSDLVVVGAAGDDAAGSRTGDPGAVAPAVDSEEPVTDPTADLDAAMLAQAQLAALPMLTSAAAAPVLAVGTGTPTAEPVAGPTDGVGAVTDLGMGDAGVPTGPVTGDPSTGADSDGSTGQPADQLSATPVTPAVAPAAAAASTDQPATPVVDASSSVTPTAAPTPTTPVPPTSGTRAADSVPGQVFPEVVRLSQSGPGTHRVTLRLDPGTLGEVRVTLTVREGEVHVRLSAQHDAREVLAHGAPELRRLLEQTGVDARVAIADLTSGTTTDQAGDRPSGRGAGTAADADQGAGHDAQRDGRYDGSERRPSGGRAGTDPGPEPVRTGPVRPGLDLAL